ncbi:MAG: metallophosphoesterase [Hyphomicrobiales bacterium]
MLTLAHLSDVHLPMPRVRLGELGSKRLIGYHSWNFRRRHIHERSIADAVRDDILAAQPDHVALTGDLINISARAEFPAGLDWLKSLGAPDYVTFVPGNHDAYVPVPFEQGLGLWGPWMAGDLRIGVPPEPGHGIAFPFVRQRRNVALIGLSTALPQPIGYATGRLGRAQIEALAVILAELRKRGFCRIVLIHHPPIPGLIEPRKALIDAPDLKVVLEEEGAELVLFGHTHEDHVLDLASRHGPVHLFGVASASANGTMGRPPADWCLYRVRRQDGVWRISASRRRYDPAARTLRDETSFELACG